MKLIEIAACGSYQEAALVKDLLETNDIPVTLVTDDGGGNVPAQTFVRGIRLAVSEGDAETAKTLLQEAMSAPPEKEAWKCPKCGEEIEGQFSDCWNCGTARED